MANHSNPLYNMIILHLQQYPCIVQKDEIDLIHEVRERFGYLSDSKVEKILGEIIKGFNNIKE
jgi:hypothetical protein